MITAVRAMPSVMCCLLTWICLSYSSALATEIQVAITGDDVHDGITAPLRSLAHAVIVARSAPKPCTILLQTGTWNDVSIQLGPDDSGLTIMAASGAHPRLLGGHRLSGWVADGDGLVAAKVPGVRGRVMDFRTLLIDGCPAARARLPARGWFTHESTFDAPWNSTAGGGFRGEDKPERCMSLVYRAGDVGSWLSIADAELTIVHSWDDSQVGLASHDEATRMLHFSKPASYPAGAFGIQRWCLWNIRQGLTQPGQWYLDHERELVVYRPHPGEDLTEHEVLMPTQEKIFTLLGTEEKPVRGIRLSGIEIVSSNIPLGSGGWAAMGLPAAIDLVWTEACEISDMTLIGVGGHGISSRAGRANTIRSCVITDAGGGGIYAVNGIGESIAANRITRPGRAANAAIALRVIGAGQMSKLSHDNVVSSNAISDCPYVGIEFEGTANRYEDNLIDRAMQVLEDGGGIYGGGSNNVIRGNTIRNITTKRAIGIYIDELGRDNVIESNRVLDCTWPLGMNESGPNVIRGNLLANHGGMRLTFRNCKGYTMEDNVIYAGGGIRLADAAAITSWKGTIAWSAIGDYGVTVGEYGILPEAIRREDPGVLDPIAGVWRLRRGQAGAVVLGTHAQVEWLSTP